MDTLFNKNFLGQLLSIRSLQHASDCRLNCDICGTFQREAGGTFHKLFTMPRAFACARERRIKTCVFSLKKKVIKPLNLPYEMQAICLTGPQSKMGPAFAVGTDERLRKHAQSSKANSSKAAFFEFPRGQECVNFPEDSALETRFHAFESDIPIECCAQSLLQQPSNPKFSPKYHAARSQQPESPARMEFRQLLRPAAAKPFYPAATHRRQIPGDRSFQ